jgi:D-sedoheptulose 7-phosphate isomerase
MMEAERLVDLYDRELGRHRAVVEEMQNGLLVFEAFYRLVGHCATAIQCGRKLLFFGNGGSAADAQHLAAELVGRYLKDRAPIAAIALTTDTSVLTATSNDYAFKDIFSRQVQALCRPGDVAIGISTSGQSTNVINGLRAARKIGATAAALTGGNQYDLLDDATDLVVRVPSFDTPRIQEMHMLLGHALCAALEEACCE